MARSSAVEHYLDTVGVGGSRPPAPTNQRPLLRPFLYLGSGGLEPPRRSGGQVGARRRPSRGGPETSRPRAQPDAWFETARANQPKAAPAAFPVPRFRRSRAAEKVRRAGRGPAEALPRRAGDEKAPCPAGGMLTRGSAPRPPGGHPLRGFRPILPSLCSGRLVETARANQPKAAPAAFSVPRFRRSRAAEKVRRAGASCLVRTGIRPR